MTDLRRPALRAKRTAPATLLMLVLRGILLLAVTAWLGPAGAIPAAAADGAVEISNVTSASWQFDPPTVRVTIGASVTWIDRSSPGSEPHTVSPDRPDAFPRSGVLRPGDQHVVRFDVAGQFAYHCDIHPSMTGLVIVAPGTTPGSAPAATLSPSAAATAAATQGLSLPPVPTPAPTIPTVPPTAEVSVPIASPSSPAPVGQPAPVPPAPDRGVLPLAAIVLAALLAALLGRRVYRGGR